MGCDDISADLFVALGSAAHDTKPKDANDPQKLVKLVFQ